MVTTNSLAPIEAEQENTTRRWRKNGLKRVNNNNLSVIFCNNFGPLNVQIDIFHLEANPHPLCKTTMHNSIKCILRELHLDFGGPEYIRAWNRNFWPNAKNG